MQWDRHCLELNLPWKTTGLLPHDGLSSFGRSIYLVRVSFFVYRFLGFSSHHAKEVIQDWPMNTSGKLVSHCVISSYRANKDITGWSKFSPGQKLRTQSSCAQICAVGLYHFTDGSLRFLYQIYKNSLTGCWISFLVSHLCCFLNK